MSTPLNTPCVRRIPKDDFVSASRPISYRPKRVAESPSPPTSVPENFLALKSAISQLEGELDNKHPTPDAASPKASTWAPLRRTYRRLTRNELDPVRKTLNYDEGDAEQQQQQQQQQQEVIVIEDGEMEEEGELPIINVEDGELDELAQKDKEDDISASLPAAPILMAVRALSFNMHNLAVENCIGCIMDYGGQMDHPECLLLPWEEKVDRYFQRAVDNMKEQDFLSFFDAVYKVEEMFDDEQDLAVGEAVEFFHFNMKEDRVVNHLKRKLLER
ncbi:uncharacterized protein [Diadema setosum]|uniref:uncharacterized protein n=1 Tax=Diadema setosum TaxID=31175 RepID=UPI003B3BB70E